jgi:hypothetical protein
LDGTGITSTPCRTLLPCDLDPGPTRGPLRFYQPRLPLIFGNRADSHETCRPETDEDACEYYYHRHTMDGVFYRFSDYKDTTLRLFSGHQAGPYIWFFKRLFFWISYVISGTAPTSAAGRSSDLQYCLNKISPDGYNSRIIHKTDASRLKR